MDFAVDLHHVEHLVQLGGRHHAHSQRTVERDGRDAYVAKNETRAFIAQYYMV